MSFLTFFGFHFDPNDIHTAFAIRYSTFDVVVVAECIRSIEEKKKMEKIQVFYKQYMTSSAKRSATQQKKKRTAFVWKILCLSLPDGCTPVRRGITFTDEQHRLLANATL